MPDLERRRIAEEHFYAGLEYFAQGQHDHAVVAYQQSMQADPGFTDPMHGLARVYQDLNRLDEAISISKRIAEIDPEDILAHTSLSLLYFKKGRVPEAEAEGNKARVLGWKHQLRAQKK
jgi:tetratricopeptide (TPR) repeat protein